MRTFDERAADSIKTRRDGFFRHYATYTLVADDRYPLQTLLPVQKCLDRAKGIVGKNPDSEYSHRVAFLQEGLNHAKLCIETAQIMNDTHAEAADRSAAIQKLITYRQSIETLGIANFDRLSVIELESWKDVPGFTDTER